MQEVKLEALLREKNGFFYLEVPQDLIEGFIKLIPRKGLDKPEKAIPPSDYVGAHISVITVEEAKKLKKSVKEVGETFEFKIEGIGVAEPQKWEDVKEVYFINVKSHELESLRKKYGFSRLIKGHDFHISVAIKRR